MKKQTSIPTAPGSPENSSAAISLSSEHMRTAVFLSLIAFAAIVIVFSIYQAHTENERYTLEMIAYTQAREAFQNEDYQASLEYLDKLGPGYAESSPAQFLLGLSYLKLGQYEPAQEALTNARLKNARLVEDQQFVYAYGDTMFQLQEYAAAQQYFLKSIQLNQNPSFTQASQTALEQIVLITGGAEHE